MYKGELTRFDFPIFGLEVECFWLESVKCQSLNRVRFFATPWTIAHQAPLFLEFSRQEYWSGLPFPSPGIERGHPALQADSLLSESAGKPPWLEDQLKYVHND